MSFEPPKPPVEESIFDKFDRLTRDLTSLEAFINSEAYKSYQAAKRQEIDDFMFTIVEEEITDITSLFRLLDVRGRLKVAKDDLDIFELARTKLKTLLDEVSEQKQQLATEFKP